MRAGAKRKPSLNLWLNEAAIVEKLVTFISPPAIYIVTVNLEDGGNQTCDVTDHETKYYLQIGL